MIDFFVFVLDFALGAADRGIQLMTDSPWIVLIIGLAAGYFIGNPRIKRAILISLFFGISVSGCSLYRNEVPSILNKPPAELQLNRNVTDYDALYYTQAVKSVFAGRAFHAERGDLAAALTTAGLATGATVAGASGAGGAVVAAIVAVGALISNAVSIVNPAQRANALSEGSNMVLTAEGKYFQSLTGAGIKVVSRRELTQFGGTLIADVNSAISITNRLLMSTLPSLADLERLKSIQSTVPTSQLKPTDAERINREISNDNLKSPIASTP